MSDQEYNALLWAWHDWRQLCFRRYGWWNVKGIGYNPLEGLL